MKTKRGKFNPFLFLILIFVCAFSFFNFIIINPNQADFIAAENNFEIVQTNDYISFSDALTAVKSKYPLNNDAITFLDKETLSTDKYGEYLITKKCFADYTNNNIDTLSTNSKPKALSISGNDALYSLTELTTQNNYTINYGENNLVLTRNFATRRLIIVSDNSNFNKCNAVEVINYKNYYILQYNTEAEASLAYDYYLTCQDIESVSIDSLCWVEDNISEQNNFVTLGLGDSFSYKTWGAEEMGVAAYSQYLKDLVLANNNNSSKLEEVVVAVLDTGIDTDHPWFENRLLLDENGKYIGMGTGDANFISTTEYDFEDDQGHGTHCAGIICDMTLPNVKILPLKFIYLDKKGEGVGSSSGVFDAMQYVLEMKKKYNIVAVNMSFGGESGASNLFNTVIHDTYNKNIFSVVAAGNDRKQDGSNEEEADVENYAPANVPAAITVSSINSELNFSWYSNLGDGVDVCAPGQEIISAWHNGELAISSGTSMAAPHIAAYIALLNSNPIHDFTRSDIEQILQGKYQSIASVKDLGYEGKDKYFGYGLPILDNLTPDYIRLNITTGSHGTASLSGLNLFNRGESVILEFMPEDRYYVSSVYVDGVLLNEVNHVDQYELNNLDDDHTIYVEFATEEAGYIVNHYWEPLYDLNTDAPDTNEYILHESELLYGRLGDLTEATAKVYAGFTLIPSFEQKTISEGAETVVNIYYKRNSYTVTIQSFDEGIQSINGAGTYLFGAPVILTPVLTDNYEWFTWKINNGDEFLQDFDLDFAQQCFDMPASDLDFTGYSKIKTLFVFVKIIGEGSVTPNSISVNYGANITLNFIPHKNSILKAVYLNGEDLNLTGTSYTTGPLTCDIEITVCFEKVVTEEDKYSILQDADLSFLQDNQYFIGLILFGVASLILLLSFRKRK